MQVRISYSPDLSKVGTLADLDDDEARVLIEQGRAVRVEDVADLLEQPKSELLERAGQVSADVKPRQSKPQIAAAIHDAETGK